ncbi:hypothetical protein ES288_D07G081500v1 [Gossypium darwinii]|uniref:Uncharacterized protein n=1 Tax=Gossypium darwinii TaxID=34276 RepID=A0A5D2BWR3_GOSDA|nr:hypothetical protein ES288_D07G081500v1 [Gossypium darwinii]
MFVSFLFLIPTLQCVFLVFVCLIKQAQSPNYNATLKLIFPNIQQIDYEVFA